MHILISPNAFKNSLNAEEAACAIKEGFLQSNLLCTCECFPIGDGGDGTGDLIVKKFQGISIVTEVHDPLGRSVQATFGLIDSDKTAIIEMANASGLRLLQHSERDPLHSTSFGTGEQIRIALDKGVTKIIIGMGGSATVDGGTGILQALGVRFLNSLEEELAGLPETLAQLSHIDTSMIDRRIFNCEIIVLCDVHNLLLGEEGSAAVYGPQKGASPDVVIKLESSLKQFAKVIFQQTGRDISIIKYGGTAGGAAAGLYAFLNAKLVNGISYFLQLTGFEKALEKTNLVVTGEGSIDEQTLQGKGPFGVAFQAKLKGLPVIALAGKVPPAKSINLQKYFDVLLPIGNEPLDMKTALASTATNLKRTSKEIGNLLSLLKQGE
ncbi:MAG: glycerate kinase [Ginsengibacter sp.]